MKIIDLSVDSRSVEYYIFRNWNSFEFGYILQNWSLKEMSANWLCTIFFYKYLSKQFYSADSLS